MTRTHRPLHASTLAAALLACVAPDLAAAQDAEACAALSAATADPEAFEAELAPLSDGEVAALPETCGAVLAPEEVAAVTAALSARGAPAPAEEAPAEEAAAEEAPAEEAPVEEAPAEADVAADEEPAALEEAPAAEDSAAADDAEADGEAAEAPAEEATEAEAPAPADAVADGADPAEDGAEADTQIEAPAEASGADAAAEAATLDAEAAEITEEVDETIADVTEEIEETETLDAGDEAAEATAEAVEEVQPAEEIADADAIAEEDVEAAQDDAVEPVEEPAPDATAEEAAEFADEPADEPVAPDAEAPDTAAEAEDDAGAPATTDEAPVQDDAEAASDEAAADEAAADEAVAETDDPVTESPLAEEAEELAAEEGQDGAALQAAEDEAIETPQEDTAEAAAAANAAPAVDEAALAAAMTALQGGEAAPAEGDAETETVTVTEETARSATEEVAARRPAAEVDDDGMSNFQKALLLGLGAVAVGQILQGQGEVVQDTGDRVVVRQGDELRVLKDDDALLRRPGAQVSTRTYDDGTTLTTVDREDGSRVITVRAANGQVLRRTVVDAEGRSTVLFDDTAAIEPVDVANLDLTARDRQVDDLRAALEGTEPRLSSRAYSLQQIRQIRAVRQLVPQIELSAITFDTGSSAIRASQAEELREIGEGMRAAIEASPGEVFLVEGHTDAVGSAASNLALSDRRAESVALALTEFFDVPPENMVVQGYGESSLKVRTGEAERENRRAAVRRITPLLNTGT